MTGPSTSSRPPSAGPDQQRDLRPVGLAVGTGLVSLVLMFLAARGGWLGADVGRGSDFCETAHAPHSLVQGHAIWHVLCAVSAYCVYRYWTGAVSPPSSRS